MSRIHRQTKASTRLNKENGSSARTLGRRDVLKGATAAAALGVGLFAGRAPAMAQERKLHFLLNSNFRPPFDAEIRKLAAEYKSVAGVDVSTEFIQNNDVPARISAAIESGGGPDLMVVQWNQAHIFSGGLTDVGKLVESAGGNRIYAASRGATIVEGVYRAVPWYIISSAMNYNKTLCDAAGVTRYPDTYNELLIAGKKLKDAGTPVGWCLGHTNGDGAFGNYPIFWAFGAVEVDGKGQVALNSREGKHAVDWMRQFWKDCCDESGTSWNDTSNNQAFLAGQIAATFNPPSIYLKARVDKMPLADQMRHTIAPAGPAGRFHLNQPVSVGIPKYGKNQAAAREFLAWLMAKPQYERTFIAGGGFALGITREFETHAFWKADPILQPFAECSKYARNMGYKGPFNRASAEVQNKYIIADTFARSLNDGTDAALKWAEQELKLIYARA